MNVIGYVISYESGSAAAYQNKIQSQKIESFCKLNKMNLVEILVEPPDGRPDFRPRLVQLLNDAPHKKFSGVVVCTLETLAKEEDIKLWIIDELKKYNITVYSAVETEKIAQKEEHTTKSKSIKLKVRNLPSLPEVVTRVTELVQDPNSSAAQLSNVIAHDSGLTSRVLRLVNSAYYGFPKQISSIQHAVMILGFTTIKGLVLSSSIFKMFAPKDISSVSLDYKKFWKHSLLTAIASKRIYQQLFFEDNENIFSAAILHDIGKIILDQYDHDNYSNVLRETRQTVLPQNLLEIEQNYCELTHTEIGAIVAEGWNLPALLLDVIKYHHTPLLSEEHNRITTVVYVGNIISQLVLNAGEPDFSTFNSDVLDHLGINEADLNEIFYIIQEEAGQLEDLESFFK